MADEAKSKKYKAAKTASGGAGGPIYGLGIIGSMVFWIQQADGFWPTIWAIIKAFIWPAFLIYDLLKHIA